MNARITSYATYKDLVGFIKCLQAGNSTTHCYNKGDNGVGASGKTTAQTHTPMCALPSSQIKAKWGTHAKGWGKKVTVSFSSGTVVCDLADLGPKGVCDLNPAALLALGLSQETELNEQGSWEWGISQLTGDCPPCSPCEPDIETIEFTEEALSNTCFEMLPPPDEPVFSSDVPIFKIWGNRGKFWPNNKILRVRFLNGDTRQKSLAWERFKTVDAWCGLAFKSVTSGPSEIRVSFNRGQGHYSYVGTDNLRIAQNHNTMNLALNGSSPQSEWDRVVIHEVLHAVGCSHEHQHPMEQIPWNREAVYQLYGRTQGWTRREIDQQVLNPGSSVGFVGTPLDTKSIMMYPVSKELVLDQKYASGWNTVPTKSDLDFLKQMYP